MYFDIGAYGGPYKPFDKEENMVFIKEWIGFDPLFENQIKEGKYTYYNHAIFDDETEKQFYIPRDKEISSFFIPNQEVYKEFRYPKKHIVEDEKIVKCEKLSTFIEKHGGDIDILKLDVHGSEYNILKEIEISRDIEKIIAIQIEMWFEYAHIGIKLRDVINEFLISNFFFPAVFTGGKKPSWREIVYINSKTDKLDKLELIKKLYIVNQDNIAHAEKTVRESIEQMEREGEDEQNRII